MRTACSTPSRDFLKAQESTSRSAPSSNGHPTRTACHNTFRAFDSFYGSEENRGVGFVHFKEAVSASAALEALNDTTPDGCEVRLDLVL